MCPRIKPFSNKIPLVKLKGEYFKIAIIDGYASQADHGG